MLEALKRLFADLFGGSKREEVQEEEVPVNRVDKIETIVRNVDNSPIPDSDPEWMKQVMADLERHEGYREYAYPDVLSTWGKLYPAAKYRWGFRPASVIMKEIGLDVKDVARGNPWTVGIGFTKGVTYTSRTTRAEAYTRKRAEIIEHNKGLDNLMPGWRTSHPLYVHTVLVNLIFNLGELRLSKFAPTLELFKRGDYKGAAARLRNTAWFKQVGVRAHELVKRLETGRIEDKHKV